MNDAKPDVASLPAKLTRLVARLRDGDWNMRTPEELAECVADAIMEAIAPAGEGGLPVDVTEAVSYLNHLVEMHRKDRMTVRAGELARIAALIRRLATTEQPGSSVQGEAVAFDGTDAEVLREFIRLCREVKPVGQWPGERVCAAIERAMANEKPFRFIAEADMAPERGYNGRGGDADRALSGPRRPSPPPAPAADHIADAGKKVAPAAEQGKCKLGCTDVCKAEAHGVPSECPDLSNRPQPKARGVEGLIAMRADVQTVLERTLIQKPNDKQSTLVLRTRINAIQDCINAMRAAAPGAAVDVGLYIAGEDDFIIRIHGNWYRARKQEMLTPEQFAALATAPEPVRAEQPEGKGAWKRVPVPEAVPMSKDGLLVGSVVQSTDWIISTDCGARVVDERMAYGWNECRKAMLAAAPAAPGVRVDGVDDGR